MAELTNEQRGRMERAVAGLKTKSEKIRALHHAGYERSPIAQFLGIRYQHVRNVLVQSQRATGKEAREPYADSAGIRRYEWAAVGTDGRVVVPAPYRRLLGVDGGGQVLMLVDDGEIRLVGRDAAVRLAQEIVAKYVPEGTRLSDELIEERRSEARREAETDARRA